MLLSIVNKSNKKVGEIEVSDEVFGAEVKPHLHWEAVRFQRASRRRGTHKTKSRGEVRGSTRKIYRQKGTGNARHGDLKAPIFVGGGTVFGPQPRDYSYRPSRSTRRAALISALSDKVARGRFVVVDELAFDAPRTKTAVGALGVFESKSAVFVDVSNDNLRLSVQNVPKSKFLRAEGVNVYDLLNHDHVIITQDALRQINGVLVK